MARASPSDLSGAEIARAARVLWIRSRRQAADLLAGEYASAFRGGGIEFEESRPYVAGDDVRVIDWNATARTGELWVKRFREERSRTVLIALDVSASMAFGTTGRSKALLGAHVAALFAAAAGHAGDRLGFVAFREGVAASLPPNRGEAHSWRVIRCALEVARGGHGRTRLEAALDWLRAHSRRHAIALLLSDFRESQGIDAGSLDSLRGTLRALTRRHDVVAVVCEDPRERVLCDAGTVRLLDPEGTHRALTLRTARHGVRRRYAAEAAARGQRLERSLRGAGVDAIRVSTGEDPLLPLVQFFRRRSAQLRLAP